MDDTAEQLARRDSFRRKLAKLQTPEQRMRELAARELIDPAQSMSPEGYARYLRRNFKKRAIDVSHVDGLGTDPAANS